MPLSAVTQCKSGILIVFKHAELHFERMLEAATGTLRPRIVIKTMDESPLDGHCVIIIPGILHHLFWNIAPSPVVSFKTTGNNDIE